MDRFHFRHRHYDRSQPQLRQVMDLPLDNRGQQMKGQQLALAVLAISLAFAMASPASGQFGVAPNRTAQPTLSPWLGLFSRETRALGNYHSYVRPQIRLRNTLYRQGNALRRQDTTIVGLGQEVRQIASETGVRPTGVGGGFMVHSQYFQTLPLADGPGRARRSPSARVPRPQSGSKSYWSLPSTMSFRSLPPTRTRGPAVTH